MNFVKKFFKRFSEYSQYKKKDAKGRFLESYVIDGKLFSCKGYEGFIGRNGKIYRKRKQAIKYGGGTLE